MATWLLNHVSQLNSDSSTVSLKSIFVILLNHLNWARWVRSHFFTPLSELNCQFVIKHQGASSQVSTPLQAILQFKSCKLPVYQKAFYHPRFPPPNNPGRWHSGTSPWWLHGLEVFLPISGALHLWKEPQTTGPWTVEGRQNKLSINKGYKRNHLIWLKSGCGWKSEKKNLTFLNFRWGTKQSVPFTTWAMLLGRSVEVVPCPRQDTKPPTHNHFTMNFHPIEKKTKHLGLADPVVFIIPEWGGIFQL